MVKYLILCCIILSSCAKYNVQKYTNIDYTQKTITVPAGNKGLKGGLKKILSNNGWNLAIYMGPEVMEGSLEKHGKIKKYSTFNTRYSLYVDSYRWDVCLHGSPYIVYEVAVVDNKSGAEVITFDGDGCEDYILKQFSESITNPQ